MKLNFGLIAATFVLLTSACIFSATPTVITQEDIAAQLGGSFQVDASQPDRPVVEFSLFFDSEVTDSNLAQLARLTSLQTLRLSNPGINDSSLTYLKGLTDLRYLQLDKSSITDAGLEHLEGLTNLQHLSLYQTNVTGTGLEYLSAPCCLATEQGLIHLQELILALTPLNDDGLKHLEGWLSLRV